MKEQTIRRLRKALLAISAIGAVVVAAVYVSLLVHYCHQAHTSRTPLTWLQVGPMTANVFAGTCPPVIVFMMALALDPEKLAEIGATKRCTHRDDDVSTHE